MNTMLRYAPLAALLSLAACAGSPGAPAPAGSSRPVIGTPDLRLATVDGRLRVAATSGAQAIDFSGAAADVRLLNGQRLLVAFDPAKDAFYVEVVEDADSPIDIALGETVIHATRSDLFEARVQGAHLDVFVKRGVLRVVGPDGTAEEVGQDGRITVVAGSKGAIEGARPPPPRAPERPKAPLRDPRRDAIRDRTDVAPAP